MSALLLLAADRRRGVTAEDIGAGGAIEFEAGVTLEIGVSTISDLTGNEGLLPRSGTVTNGGAFEAGVTLQIEVLNQIKVDLCGGGMCVCVSMCL